MRKQETSCDICRRLGKNECGYHQFKNQYLSRFSKNVQENDFVQTQSSVHRNPPPFGYSPIKNNPQLTLSAHTRTFTPNKITNGNPNFVYHQSHSPFRPIPSNTLISNPHSRIIFSPSRPFQPISQLPPPPQTLPPQQLVRVEGGKLLYYPIYPVYEVVYEPVSVNSSFSPSRILQ